MVNLTINVYPGDVYRKAPPFWMPPPRSISKSPACAISKELNEIAACRVCCVEVEGEGKLVPACNNVVREGMVVQHQFSACARRRAASMWSLSSRSTTTSARPVCAAGTCQLQKIANDLGILDVPYPTDLARGKKPDWTTTFPLYRDVNKCIKCMRCIQVCDKVQSLSVWDISGIGCRTTIDVSGQPRRSSRRTARCAGSASPTVRRGALRERDDTQKVICCARPIRTRSPWCRLPRRCAPPGARPSACRPARPPSGAWSSVLRKHGRELCL